MSYAKAKKALKLAWKDDDLMDQEVLFELQDVLADLALSMAKKEHKTDDLVKSFPWLFRSGKEEK